VIFQVVVVRFLQGKRYLTFFK